MSGPNPQYYLPPPSLCPVCRGQRRHIWMLKVTLAWLGIVALSLWILLSLIGMVAIAGIAKYGPTWPH